MWGDCCREPYKLGERKHFFRSDGPSSSAAYSEFCCIRSSGYSMDVTAQGRLVASPRVADRLAPGHARACDDSDSTLRNLSWHHAQGLTSGNYHAH
jgi:hypothetical protein